MTDFAHVQLVVKNELSRAQKQFAKEPNAQNWTLTLQAMLVHQQLHQIARPVHSAMRAGLLVRLADLTMGEWPECIVRTMTGESIGQILAKH